MELEESKRLQAIEGKNITTLESENLKLKEINSALLDSTLDPILIVGTFGNYVNSNIATKSLLGLSESVLNQSLIKEPDNSLQESSSSKILLIETEKNKSQEVSYVTKTLVGNDLVLYILYDPIAIPSLTTTIKEKTTNQLASTISNSNPLTSALDNIPTILSSIGRYNYDLMAERLLWPPETYNIFGVSREEFDSKIDSFWALIHPEDLSRVQQVWQTVITQHHSCKHQYRVVTPCKEVKWIKEKARVIFDQANKAYQIEGYYQDITESKIKEERLSQQAALLDIVQSAIIICDSKGIVTFWNKFATHLYGWEKEEAIGSFLADLVNNKDRSQWNNCYKTILIEGSLDQDLQHYTKTNTPLTINSRWSTMESEETNSHILIVNTDVTEKKKLEANFLRVQRMESVGALAGGIAHDLNNMLSPILMSVQILKKKNVDPVTQRMLATLESTVQRGADLVRQILSFSRGFEGKHYSIDIKQIVSEIEKLVKEIFPRSIEFNLEMDKDLWSISGDATQIHQILLNLCLNSRDAMPKAGMLKVAVTNVTIDKHYAQMRSGCSPGRYVLISISDNGQGIPAEHLEKIFDPFFTTKDPGKGTGLGLSTVMSIVKSYHGFINVFSELNKGTVFNIYLPVTESSTKPQQPVLESIPFIGNDELILVIDDEFAIREITKSTLEIHNYRVITASDGIEGLTTFVQNKDEVKLVITDIMMPHMDGIATIRAIQKVNPSIKVISITGLASSSREVELSSLGVNKILSKPYTADILLATISELLTGTP